MGRWVGPRPGRGANSYLALPGASGDPEYAYGAGGAYWSATPEQIRLGFIPERTRLAM